MFRSTQNLLYEFPIELLLRKEDWERLSPEIKRECTIKEEDDFYIRVHFWGIAKTPIIDLQKKR